VADTQNSATEVTDENFDTLARTGWALVDFHATWRPHCKAFRPIHDAFAQTYTDPVALPAADVDLAKQATAEFKLRSAPTLVLLHDGQKVEQRTGNLTADGLQEWLESEPGV
jgi:thioredoxin-like negative regulator of GroEL